MSLVDVNKIFTYSFPTSSIDYVKNYNFSSNTVSNLPLTIGNSSKEFPITVNITSSKSWIRVLEATSYQPVMTPAANIVLQASSSRNLLVSIDLPSELDNAWEASVFENLIFDIVTGSNSIVSATSNRQNRNKIVPDEDIVILNRNETKKLSIKVYDDSGVEMSGDTAIWNVIDTTVARVSFTEPSISYLDRNITGINVGSTDIIIVDGTLSAKVTVRVNPAPAQQRSGGGDTFSRPPAA